MSTWKFEHEGSEIAVVNSWNGEKLFVNQVLQDEQVGMASRSRLYGSVQSNESQNKQIKVSIGGWFNIGCTIFIDSKEVFRSFKKTS